MEHGRALGISSEDSYRNNFAFAKVPENARNAGFFGFDTTHAMSLTSGVLCILFRRSANRPIQLSCRGLQSGPEIVSFPLVSLGLGSTLEPPQCPHYIIEYPSFRMKGEGQRPYVPLFSVIPALSTRCTHNSAIFCMIRLLITRKQVRETCRCRKKRCVYANLEKLIDRCRCFVSYCKKSGTF